MRGASCHWPVQLCTPTALITATAIHSRLVLRKCFEANAPRCRHSGENLLSHKNYCFLSTRSSRACSATRRDGFAHFWFHGDIAHLERALPSRISFTRNARHHRLLLSFTTSLAIFAPIITAINPHLTTSTPTLQHQPTNHRTITISHSHFHYSSAYPVSVAVSLPHKD